MGRRWESAKPRVPAVLPDRFCCQWGFLRPITSTKFFGIAGAHVQAEGNASPEKNTLKISLAPRHDAAAEPVLEGEILDKDDEPILQQQPVPPLADIEAVINRALRAAGLLKG
jgi:hypothetical protein